MMVALCRIPHLHLGSYQVLVLSKNSTSQFRWHKISWDKWCTFMLPHNKLKWTNMNKLNNF
uniref:Uncharacterized protein n=1 Tax=Arundo donax TaxID=35708 RepID=A0A0A9C7K2_ARUDO